MNTQSMPYAFFEGNIVPTEKAKISVMTKSFQYGIGAFGGIRGYYNKSKKTLFVFRVSDHFRRFISAVKILGTSITYSETQLLEITRELVIKNRSETDCYFRPFAYASDCTLTPNIGDSFEFGMYMIPLGDYIPTNKGLSVMVSTWRRISDNAIPSRGKFMGAYVNSALARKEASLLGFDEAIMLTEEGHVAEGSAENIFIVRDGVLVTPSKSDNILEGITRKTVMEIAHDLHIPVESRSIDRTELYVAQEAFFTGTGAQVAWIRSVDGRIVGSGERGPITGQIQDAFFKIVHGDNSAYDHWYTKIQTGKGNI